MTKHRGESGAWYENCTPEFIAWHEEVRSWRIVPLKYAITLDLQLTHEGQELGLIDLDILSDPSLTPLEFRIMIEICRSYPAEFTDIVPCEGVDGYVVPELSDEVLVRATLINLQDKGYIVINKEP